MSTPLATVKNEAASRLRDSMYDLAVTPDREAFLLDLDAALAAERRATVERLIEWLQPVRGSMPENLWAFLDEIAS